MKFDNLENSGVQDFDGQNLAGYKKYIGQINKDGMPHGYGYMTYRDGTKYKGEWQDEQRHGFGKKFTASTGEWVIEIFEHDNVERIVWGVDEVMLDGGRKYNGMLIHSQPNGHGVMNSTKGEHYEG